MGLHASHTHLHCMLANELLGMTLDRDGAPIHVDYINQFSGAAAPKGEGSRGGKRKRGSSGAAEERGGVGQQLGHWSTEYARNGPVKVCMQSVPLPFFISHPVHAGEGRLTRGIWRSLATQAQHVNNSAGGGVWNDSEACARGLLRTWPLKPCAACAGVLHQARGAQDRRGSIQRGREGARRGRASKERGEEAALAEAQEEQRRQVVQAQAAMTLCPAEPQPVSAIAVVCGCSRWTSACMLPHKCNTFAELSALPFGRVVLSTLCHTHST